MARNSTTFVIGSNKRPCTPGGFAKTKVTRKFSVEDVKKKAKAWLAKKGIEFDDGGFSR